MSVFSAICPNPSHYSNADAQGSAGQTYVCLPFCHHTPPWLPFTPHQPQQPPCPFWNMPGIFFSQKTSVLLGLHFPHSSCHKSGAFTSFKSLLMSFSQFCLFLKLSFSGMRQTPFLICFPPLHPPSSDTLYYIICPRQQTSRNQGLLPVSLTVESPPYCNNAQLLVGAR